MNEVLELFSSPELFEEELLEDAKQPVKVGAPFDESSVMIAVVVTDSSKRVLLTNSETIDDPVWYVPSGDVENGECLVHAAKRYFLAETGLELINAKVSSIENYPSLRRNFIRYIATGDLAQGSPDPDASKCRWFQIEDLASQSIPLLSMDIQSVCKSMISKQPDVASFMPMVSSEPLHCLSVRVGLVIDEQFLVVRKSPKHNWRLPSTFADYRCGESLSFASQRLSGRFLNIIPDVIGSVHVQHGFHSDRAPSEGFLGSCITVLAHSKLTMDKAKSTLGGKLDDRCWKFISCEEALKMTADEESQKVIKRLILGQCITISSV